MLNELKALLKPIYAQFSNLSNIKETFDNIPESFFSSSKKKEDINLILPL